MMFWQKFLEEMAKQAGLRGKKRSHFLKIYAIQDGTEFREIPPQERYEGIGYTSESSYNQLLSNFYDAFRDLLKEDGIVLLKQKGRSKGEEANYVKIHGWLTKRYATWVPPQAQHGFSDGVSDSMQYGYRFHRELKDLVFGEEEAQFARYVRQERCSAYLIQATGRDSQYWLARRAAEKITNFSTSERHVLDLKNRFLCSELSELWLSLSCNEGRYESSDDKKTIIDRIAKKCVSKNIIITLYGITKAHSEIWEPLLNDFWNPLKDCIKASSGTGKCILIMTANSGFSQSNLLPENSLPTKVPALELEEISDIDWNDWIEGDRVVQLWTEANRIGRSPPAFPHTQVPDKPQAILESMCSQLKIGDDVNEGIDYMRHRVWNLQAA
jgi:inactive STAND